MVKKHIKVKEWPDWVLKTEKYIDIAGHEECTAAGSAIYALNECIRDMFQEVLKCKNHKEIEQLSKKYILNEKDFKA